jgi:hypothetical protein
MKVEIVVSYSTEFAPMTDETCKLAAERVIRCASGIAEDSKFIHALPSNTRALYDLSKDTLTVTADTSNELFIGMMRAYWNLAKLDTATFSMVITQITSENGMMYAYHSDIDHEGRFTGPTIPRESYLDWHLCSLLYGEEK